MSDPRMGFTSSRVRDASEISEFIMHITLFPARQRGERADTEEGGGGEEEEDVGRRLRGIFYPPGCVWPEVY